MSYPNPQKRGRNGEGNQNPNPTHRGRHEMPFLMSQRGPPVPPFRTTYSQGYFLPSKKQNENNEELNSVYYDEHPNQANIIRRQKEERLRLRRNLQKEAKIKKQEDIHNMKRELMIFQQELQRLIQIYNLIIDTKTKYQNIPISLPDYQNERIKDFIIRMQTATQHCLGILQNTRSMFLTSNTRLFDCLQTLDFRNLEEFMKILESIQTSIQPYLEKKKQFENLVRRTSTTPNVRAKREFTYLHNYSGLPSPLVNLDFAGEYVEGKERHQLLNPKLQLAPKKSRRPPPGYYQQGPHNPLLPHEAPVEARANAPVVEAVNAPVVEAVNAPVVENNINTTVPTQPATQNSQGGVKRKKEKKKSSKRV